MTEVPQWWPELEKAVTDQRVDQKYREAIYMAMEVLIYIKAQRETARALHRREGVADMVWCAECDLDGPGADPTVYPCPTAKALGVTS